MRTYKGITVHTIQDAYVRDSLDIVDQYLRQVDSGFKRVQQGLSPSVNNIQSATADLTNYLYLLGQGGGQTLVSADAASSIFSIQGASSQSGKLQRWLNSSGTVLASISAAGLFQIGPVTGTALTVQTDSSGLAIYAADGTTLYYNLAPGNTDIQSNTVNFTRTGDSLRGLYITQFSGSTLVSIHDQISRNRTLTLSADSQISISGNNDANFTQTLPCVVISGSVASGTVSGNPAALQVLGTHTANPGLQVVQMSGSTQTLISACTNVGVDRFYIDSSFRWNMVGSTSGVLTWAVPATVTSYTLTWPSAQGAASSVLLNNGSGTLSWASLSTFGAAANTEAFVTIGTTSGLTAERALTGTANQITVTDNGAGSTVVLSTPQALDTAAAFRIGTLGIGAAAAANIALDVTGSTTFRAVTETQLASSPTAYAIGNATFIRQDATGVRQIKGIAGGADGRMLLWRVTGTQAYQFNHEDAAATAANRIHTSQGVSVAASLDQFYFIVYDATTARWILQKWAEPGGTETITGSWTHQNALTIDMGASSGGGTLVLWGASGGAEPYLIYRDATTGFDSYLTWGAVSTPRNLQLPDADDTLAGKATVDNFTNKTLKNTCSIEVSTASSGTYIVDATTSTKRIRPICSGVVGTQTLTFSSTAARDWAIDSDFSCRIVSSGNTAVAAAAAVAAGSLGKHDSTGNTVSVAATTIGKTLPAGMYKVHWYIKVTTAGDVVATDNLTVTIAWNDGAAQSRAQNSDNETSILSVLPVNTLNRAFAGDQTVYCAASTDVTVAAALVNGGITNPVFDFRARIEAL